MDRFNVNRKRPVPSYNDFGASKRLQQSNPVHDHDSLFVSDDDEGGRAIDEDLFRRNDDSNFAALVNSLEQQSVQPVQQIQSRPQSTTSRITQPRNTGSSTAQPRRVSQTTNTPITNGSTATIDGNVTTSTSRSSVAQAPTPTIIDLIDIKPETDETTEPDHLKILPSAEKVKLFIGRQNKEVTVKRADLSKSPVLNGWIIDDPDQGAYVMRPQLASQDFVDFDAISQYLYSSEYAPLLVDNRLDGLKTNEAYAKELVRSGRIYIIAQTFQIEGLADLVFSKIEKVDVTKFSIRSIVELAGIIFADKRAQILPQPTPTAVALAATNGANGAGDEQNENTVMKDQLEEWIITQVAKNFQEIMKAQQDTFWVVVQQTSKKMLLAKVLEEVALQYRATGGRLVSGVVELD